MELQTVTNMINDQQTVNHEIRNPQGIVFSVEIKNYLQPGISQGIIEYQTSKAFLYKLQQMKEEEVRNTEQTAILCISDFNCKLVVFNFKPQVTT